jgi:membrane-associated HD superfamily phosphohydrolase
MANKYHRQSFSKGKLVTETVKKAREAFKNIYKTNKKKENVVDQLNKNLKKQRKKTGAKPEQEPYNLDVYTDVMVSDFDKKTGPYFDRLKKLKGKK